MTFLTENRGPIECQPGDATASMVPPRVGSFIAMPDGHLLCDFFRTPYQIIASMAGEPALRGPCLTAAREVEAVLSAVSRGIEGFEERTREAMLAAGLLLGEVGSSDEGITIKIAFDAKRAGQDALLAGVAFLKAAQSCARDQGKSLDVISQNALGEIFSGSVESHLENIAQAGSGRVDIEKRMIGSVAPLHRSTPPLHQCF